jgi:hypothetical protein
VTYLHQPKVNPEIAEKSKRDIDAINTYVDKLKGTVVTIQTIQHGQPRPYADSAYEAVIACHQPNAMTTNAPSFRTLTKDDALALARIFVHDFTEDGGPYGMSPRLIRCSPDKNPFGIVEKFKPGEGRAYAWRVLITQPYCD